MRISSLRTVDFRDAAWASAIRLSGLVVAVGTSVLLARLASPPVLGAWFVVRGLSAVLTAVSEFGVPLYVVRPIARGQSNSRLVRSALLVVAGASSIVLAAGALYARGPYEARVLGPAAPYSLLIAALACLAALERLGAEVLRGQGRIRDAALGNQFLSRALFVPAILIASLFVGSVGVWTIGIVMLSSTALAVTISWRTLLKHLDRASVTPTSIGPKEVAFHSLPLVANRLAGQAILSGDLIIVGALLGATASADYGIALRIAAVVALPLTILNVLAPHRVASAIDDPASRVQLQTWLTVGAKIAGLATAAIWLVFAAFGGLVLRIIFGAQYEAAHPLILVLGAGQVVSTLVGPASNTLLNAGHRRLVAFNTSIFAASMIGIAVAVAGYTRSTLWVAGVAASVMAAENLSAWILARRVAGVRTDAFAVRTRTTTRVNTAGLDG